MKLHAVHKSATIAEPTCVVLTQTSKTIIAQKNVL